MRRLDRWTFITLLFLSSGCSNWTRLPEGITPQPAKYRLFEVWTGTQRYLWHALRVERDSLTGIPFSESRECERCREGVAAAEVDSIRAETTDRSSSDGFSILAVWIMGGFLLFHLIRTAIYGGT